MQQVFVSASASRIGVCDISFLSVASSQASRARVFTGQLGEDRLSVLDANSIIPGKGRFVSCAIRLSL
ncbi:MAG: hypothetical protein M3Y57_09965 [Acidobacteriota bacterium]|nr:hypothetical protein [Acidobacteriota bacterium]